MQEKPSNDLMIFYCPNCHRHKHVFNGTQHGWEYIKREDITREPIWLTCPDCRNAK